MGKIRAGERMRTTISEETIERLAKYAREKVEMQSYNHWGPGKLVVTKGGNREEFSVTIDEVVQQLLEKEGY